METKVCTACQIEKPLTDFHPRRRPNCKTTVRSQCKECERAKRRRRYSENRDQELAQMRRWQEKNKGHLVAYRREYNKSPQGRARLKRYNESEHGSKKRKEYQRSEARCEASRRWSRANKHKKLAVLHVYRAKKNGILVQPPACEQCGLETEDIRAHHHKGYAPEHHLDVMWLCVPCHENAHHNLTD